MITLLQHLRNASKLWHLIRCQVKLITLTYQHVCQVTAPEECEVLKGNSTDFII